MILEHNHAGRRASSRRTALSTILVDVLVLGLSVASRFIGLAHQPLWLDELYSHQVSQQSWTTLLNNSRFESHPPLYYALLKLAPRPSFVEPEVALRWLSAVCGALALLGFYVLLRRAAGRGWAVVGWTLLLVSPTLLYYSQEARSYSLAVLLATLSLGLMLQLLAGDASARTWAAWSGISVLGFYTTYSYLMVFLLQAAFLSVRYRLAWRCLAALGSAGACMALLLPLLTANVSQDLSLAQSGGSLPLGLLVAAVVAGDPLRYGMRWWSTLLPAALGVLALGALGDARSRRGGFGWYLLAQVLLPPALIVGLGAGLLGWRIPAFQTRQFMIVLPAFVLATTLGLRWIVGKLPGWPGYLLLGAASAAVVLASAGSIQQYWTTGKSPEGLAVHTVRRSLQPGQSIVSLQYSLDAAVSFYIPPTVPVFNAPAAAGGTYRFAQNLLILRGQRQREHAFAVADIRARAPFWVLTDTRDGTAVKDALIAECATGTPELFGPFETLIVQRCP